MGMYRNGVRYRLKKSSKYIFGGSVRIGNWRKRKNGACGWNDQAGAWHRLIVYILAFLALLVHACSFSVDSLA